MDKISNTCLWVWKEDPDYLELPYDKFDWEYPVYGDVRDLLPDDASINIGKYIRFTHYVDDNLFGNQFNGSSVTSILHLVNKTPVDWYYKKHITVDKLTYGYEFVSDCNCVDQIIDLRNTLQYLGLPIH